MRVKTNDQQFHSDNINGSWHTQKDLPNAYLRTTRAGLILKWGGREGNHGMPK